MLRTVLLIICFCSVQYSKGSPWERNNNIREFDLEWQCEQFCNRLKGKLTYNSNDSECTCSVNEEDKLDFNTKHLEHKLSDLGFNFKIIDETKIKIKKRETAAEKINKIIAEKSNIVEATGPKPDIEIPSEPKDDKTLIKERLQRLREKLRNPKVEKSIITAPDNMLLGKAAPASEKENKDEKPIEQKEDNHEKLGEVKHPKVTDHKQSEIKDTVVGNTHIVGDPPKEEPKKNDKLEEIRLKLQAWKQAHQPDVAHKNPEKVEEKKEEDNKKEDITVGVRRTHLIPHIHLPLTLHRPLRPILPVLGEKAPDNEEADKKVSDKIKEMRERIRMKLQSIRAKTHPNEDGHVEENH